MAAPPTDTAVTELAFSFETYGRPRRVPIELRCYANTRADRHCQRRTRVRRRRVARIVFDRSQSKLQAGVPLEDVIDHNAPGGCTIQHEYARRHGRAPSRSTISEDL